MELLFASPTLLPWQHSHRPLAPPRHYRHAFYRTCQTAPLFLSPIAQEVLVRPQKSLPAVIVRGGDRIKFVNGMGTNAFSESTTEPVQTVLTSNIGRCVDLVTAVRYGEHVLLLSSLPDGELYQYLDRYIFPADDVAIENCSLCNVAQVMGGAPATVEVADGMRAIPTLFGAIVVAERGEMEHGEWVSRLGREVGDDEWEIERVQRGIPQLGVDISRDQTALEAGLWSWVSFDKGCYIGQETIARQNTYNGVRTDLRLMEFEGEVVVGDAIEKGEEEQRKAGLITSVSIKDGRCRAFGYIRRKSGLSQVGKKVKVGETEGEVVEATALSYGYEERSLLAL